MYVKAFQFSLMCNFRLLSSLTHALHLFLPVFHADPHAGPSYRYLFLVCFSTASSLLGFVVYRKSPCLPRRQVVLLRFWDDVLR